MLGWALHKATGNAPQNAPNPGPDDTFAEQPDTPAPVFAARAFKRALFGTPAPQREVQSRKETRAAAARSEKARSSNVDDYKRYESPTRPPGILLTPGTGTSRRKRVSFGRDVKSNTLAANTEAAKSRPRTKLQEALEKSRKENNRASGGDKARKPTFDLEEAEGDGAWEEVDELDREPDITVDLNEPRSQSGQYWKSEFQKYHDEARAEMEKLVKYKQLAKSYAKAKDAEALDLNERLREEQSKVVQMEQKITELAGQVTAKQGQGKDTRDDRKLMKDLTRQTALAVQYREQVEELETLLRESGYDTDGNRRRRGGTSPRTAQTLLETQRELRKAREQVKELNDLRYELKRVKTELSTAEQRALKLEGEKKKAVADLAKSELKVADLERKLAKAEQDRQRKDVQCEKLKADCDALREQNRTQRAPRSGSTQQLKQDLDLLSAGRNALDSWEYKFTDAPPTARDRQSTRRRGVEDASAAVDNPRLDQKRFSDHTSLGQRFQGLKNKGGDGTEDIGHDLLQIRPRLGEIQTEAPLARSASRSAKRKASGLAALDHLAFPDEDFTLDTPSRKISRTPSREFRVSKSPHAKSNRLSAPQPTLSEPKSPALGLARDRARTWKLDQAPDNPTTEAVSSRPSSLPADRRAAAIARLEQKRAERRRGHESAALPGKENLRPMDSKPPDMDGDESDDSIETEIQDLQQRLEKAKARLRNRKATPLNGTGRETHNGGGAHHHAALTLNKSSPPHKTTHFLLLLADSALPLGSFAFSSGLESFLAHNRSSRPGPGANPQFDLFLPVSVSSYASTTLPFVLAAHRDPRRLPGLDDHLDAAVMCTVGRRASVAQGRALLGIWERSFSASAALAGGSGDHHHAAAAALGEYARALRAPAGRGFDDDGTGIPPVAAHLAPLFGVVCRAAGLGLHQAAYVFVLGHVKALVSAAVRANLLGPYQAQRLLAGSGVMGMIAAAVEREWDTPVEEAGQSVPVMDLWVGRHEVLYSRIFNS
ncbi:hypothetical protein KVR01_011244 [Diaporthe batatas]|uniref:uncharacterized protein n=1 Tax=Diaporthe batatas TaxID=748121 RepID=UPI001D03C909|nr:uncharacterized protein KVR01_011244 [Diaporthe batatas]KAG8158801.1 hypothetical protein KVR01_011244 [Diaporthe batatas]